MSPAASPSVPSFAHPDRFAVRHIGPDAADQRRMAEAMGYADATALADAAVPANIRRPALDLPEAVDEHAMLRELAAIAGTNQVWRSCIGQGYHGTLVPAVIRRNVLENPGWYTQYTPYQAEISQGRLECLLAFQTLACELTGLAIANASLLDEATAAAEAMHAFLGAKADRQRVFVDARCHPQTIAVVRTRAAPLDVEVIVGDSRTATPDATWAGAIVQYPTTDGVVEDYRTFAQAVHAAGALVAAACDPLALVLLAAPASWGADIAFGSAQRFGVPMAFGGPHAAFFAVSEPLKRLMPGRLVGVSRDRHGNRALRLALQTREQHIRREKATSNICTAQALLANMAAQYAIWHGPEGLTAIAQRVRAMAATLAAAIQAAGWTVETGLRFDTLVVAAGARADAIIARAEAARINLRRLDGGRIAVALDETIGGQDLADLAALFNARIVDTAAPALPAWAARTGAFLPQPIFHGNRSETAMLRLLRKWESQDLSLCHSMIPLGSCTMKLNASAEMLPVTWDGFAGLHPFAPPAQYAGYRELFTQLERWLAECTGFDAVSLQPNAGSQGEYAGLLAIKGWQEARGQGHRKACLIPMSAHGTNPATAAMAGMTVVPVKCDALGNIDLADLEAQAEAHKDDLACIMVTYPSTHGVFESGIKRLCEIVHARGGQVYMDGANMNAQVGLTSPGHIGADVCHLNLHKTFCIPHGGGGPGMGPICVKAHLAKHLPGHPEADLGGAQAGAVSAAPWGSAAILVIPWAYIRMMGGPALTDASRVAILSANYIAHRLAPHFPILYRGERGLVAHECIVDLRPAKAKAGIEAEDVAKRLMDFGFHAPTLSFPVPGTLMIEPTESEPIDELDRFCEAMIAIAAEIQAVAEGRLDKADNPLKNAPHTQAEVISDSWKHPYGREQAAFPLPWVRTRKFWPSTARVDGAYGDRNLVCTCEGMERFR